MPRWTVSQTANDGLFNSATTNDDIFVFNGHVVFRKHDMLPGFTAPISVIEYRNQSNNGDWLALFHVHFTRTRSFIMLTCIVLDLWLEVQ